MGKKRWNILAAAAAFGSLFGIAIVLTILTAVRFIDMVEARTSGDMDMDMETKTEELSVAEAHKDVGISGYPVLDVLPEGGSEEDFIKLVDGESGENCYIPRQRDSMGGLSSDACHYDVLKNWAQCSTDVEVCLTEWVSYDRDGLGVYTHVTENRTFRDGVGADGWKRMQQDIVQAAEKAAGVEISDLSFERYVREDGSELLFYSFVSDNGTDSVRYAAAYTWGESYMAEFIGYEMLYPGITAQIGEITRYMAASYVELGGEKTWANLKYRPFLGHEDWPWEDLHNPFAIAEHTMAVLPDAPLTVEDRELAFSSEEWEDLLYQVVRYHYELNDQAWRELRSRPLRLSDLAFIREVVLTESPIPGRDEVSFSTGDDTIYVGDCKVSDFGLTTLEDLAVLPNLEKVTLNIGGVADYEALGNCTGLTEIAISSEVFLTDVDWLTDLPNLKFLRLRKSDMSYLFDNGYLGEGESSFGEKAMDENKPGARSLEEVLAECKSLEYLYLGYSGDLDYGFLEELPDLYAFCLYPESDFGEDELDRSDSFPEDYCPHIKCLVIDDEWIRNPE